MTVIEAIADRLEDEGIGVVNTSIHIGELPLDKSDVIAIMPTPSPDPDKAIPYFTQRVDVWARYSDYEDGYTKLQEVFDALHQQENYDLFGYHVYLSYAVGMIQDNERDAERRHLFQLTLGFIYRNASGS